MSDQLQIPHPLSTVAGAFSTHLVRFRQSCPNDFHFHQQRKGAIESFHLQLAPVMHVGFRPRELDLGYIILRRLDKNLTELVIQDSERLNEGPGLFLGVKMLFSDEEVDYDRQLSLKEGKALAELRQIRSTIFDLRRLVRLCEELNDCSASGSYCAVAALVRTIINHVPPIFGAATFSEVANNIGGKSYKKSLFRLQTASRDISDAVLHQQIQKREVLPTSTQVDFKSELDVLLGEIIRRLG
jgi:hypothetical protein